MCAGRCDSGCDPLGAEAGTFLDTNGTTGRQRAGRERVLLRDKERQGSDAVFFEAEGMKLSGMNNKLTIQKSRLTL